MSSYAPKVIRTYHTELYGQLVEVKVYSEGASGRLPEEEDVEEMEVEQQAPTHDHREKDLTEIFEEIESYLVEIEEDDQET